MPTEPRSALAARGLVPRAVQHLTADALGAVPFERLGAVKGLLKRYFSTEEWGDAERRALEEAVGPGEGTWRHDVDGFVLNYGWKDDRFAIDVTAGDHDAGIGESASRYVFSGPAIPEATPNPRTVMFRTGPIHGGESLEFRRGESVTDERAAAVMEAFPDVATLMVARDFVSVSLRRADVWEDILPDVVDAIAEVFIADREFEDHAPSRPVIAGVTGASQTARRDGPRTALDRAWEELRSLDPTEQDDRAAVIEASRSGDANRRQVAAVLLGDAPRDVAHAEWSRLVGDSSRRVRRAVVDTVVDAGREELRHVLEQALADTDAWIRWKAVRGLLELGPARSREVIEPLIDDPDFRVRLEANRALSAR